MYKKSLILLLTIFYGNLFFGDNTVTGPTLHHVFKAATDVELFEKLNGVALASSIKYLTLQQELHKNNDHENNSLSKREIFGATALVSSAGVFVIEEFLKKDECSGMYFVFTLGFWSSLIGIWCTKKETHYTDKNTEILTTMESIDLTPLHKK